MKITIDEVLASTECSCGQCGGSAKIYPVPSPNGTCVCPKCSPNWLESFLTHLTNKERTKHNLKQLRASGEDSIKGGKHENDNNSINGNWISYWGILSV